jgi:hypothetical protein
LPCVAEVRHNGGDTGSRGAPQRVDHQQQLNDVVVCGVASALQHKNILASNVFVQFNGNLAIGEFADSRITHPEVQSVCNLASKRRVGIACKHHHFR